jgi:hypothetical protein
MKTSRSLRVKTNVKSGIGVGEESGLLKDDPKQ